MQATTGPAVAAGRAVGPRDATGGQQGSREAAGEAWGSGDRARDRSSLGPGPSRVRGNGQPQVPRSLLGVLMLESNLLCEKALQRFTSLVVSRAAAPIAAPVLQRLPAAATPRRLRALPAALRALLHRPALQLHAQPPLGARHPAPAPAPAQQPRAQQGHTASRTAAARSALPRHTRIGARPRRQRRPLGADGTRAGAGVGTAAHRGGRSGGRSRVAG